MNGNNPEFIGNIVEVSLLSKIRQVKRSFSGVYVYLSIQVVIIMFLAIFDSLHSTDNLESGYINAQTENLLVLIIAGITTFFILHNKIKEIFGASGVKQILEIKLKLKVKLFFYSIILRLVPIVPLVIFFLITNNLESTSVIAKDTTENVVLSVIAVCFVAPFVEEVIFRGVVLNKLSSIVSFRAANIMQAVVFMLFHANLVQMVTAIILGCFQGKLVEKYKSLGPAIILHLFFNCTGFLIHIYNNFI